MCVTCCFLSSYKVEKYQFQERAVAGITLPNIWKSTKACVATSSTERGDRGALPAAEISLRAWSLLLVLRTCWWWWSQCCARGTLQLGELLGLATGKFWALSGEDLAFCSGITPMNPVLTLSASPISISQNLTVKFSAVLSLSQWDWSP